MRDSVTDYFKIIGMPRSPWLDPEDVKSRFIELSKSCHPDKFHNAGDVEKREAEKRYQELNQASQVLSITSQRLRHLLELESNEPPRIVEKLPEPVMDLFMEVAGILKSLDNCIRQKQEVSNPLLKTALIKKAMDLTPATTALIEKIKNFQHNLESSLKSLTKNWVNDPAGRQDYLAEMEVHYRSIAHTDKWLNQLNEKLFTAKMGD